MKEKGVHLIESLQFEEHEMLRRAATECMCNMILNEEVQLSQSALFLVDISPLFYMWCRCLKCMLKIPPQKE